MRLVPPSPPRARPRPGRGARLLAWLVGLTGRRSEPARPSYSVRVGRDGLSHVIARGDQPQATQVLVEAVRAFTGPLGLILVEVHGRAREWAGENLDRTAVLAALLQARDLWGRGVADLALFYAGEGVEIYFDRFGLLEMRAGGWAEPRLRAILELQGFGEVSRLSSLPLPPKEVVAPTPETLARLGAIREALGLAAPESPEARGSV